MTGRLGHETLASRRKKARGGGYGNTPVHEEDPSYKGPTHPCRKCGHGGFWHIIAGKDAGCQYAVGRTFDPITHRMTDPGKECPCGRFER